MPRVCKTKRERWEASSGPGTFRMLSKSKTRVSRSEGASPRELTH